MTPGRQKTISTISRRYPDDTGIVFTTILGVLAVPNITN